MVCGLTILVVVSGRGIAGMTSTKWSDQQGVDQGPVTRGLFTIMVGVLISGLSAHPNVEIWNHLKKYNVSVDYKAQL